MGFSDSTVAKSCALLVGCRELCKISAQNEIKGDLADVIGEGAEVIFDVSFQIEWRKIKDWQSN